MRQPRLQRNIWRERTARRSALSPAASRGRGNLEALSCIFDIGEVKAYDLYPELADRFAAEMGPRLGVRIEPVREVSQAVRELDLVVTSGPIRETAGTRCGGRLARGGIFCPARWISTPTSGPMHFVKRTSWQATIRISWNITGRPVFFEDAPVPYADLGEIAAGLKPGRESDRERTIAINLGLGLEDMATAILVYRRAAALGIGTELPL